MSDIELGDNVEFRENSNGELVLEHTPSGATLVYDSSAGAWTVGDFAATSVNTGEASIGNIGVELPFELLNSQNFTETTQMVNLDIDISDHRFIKIIGTQLVGAVNGWGMTMQMNNYGSGTDEDAYTYSLYDETGFASRDNQTEWQLIESYGEYITAEVRFGLPGGAVGVQRPSIAGRGGAPNSGLLLTGGSLRASGAGVPNSIQLSSSAELVNGALLVYGGGV